MGTDIHLVAEARNDDGTWEIISGPIVPCWSCDGQGMVTRENHKWAREDWLAEHLGATCNWCKGEGKVKDSWYGDRNYNVFAVVGDVRNGSGFAGCDTGDRVEPIASFRGFPDDMSPEAHNFFYPQFDEDGEPVGEAGFEGHYGGDHSENWLSLQEIMSYEWDKPQVHRGWVSANEYATFKQQGRPNSWSGGISGGGVKHVSNREMDKVIANPTLMAEQPTGPFGGTHYTKIEWTTTIRESCEGFLERMKMLALTAGERDVRIIFNFDS